MHQRVLSIDLFRGVVMFLLVGGVTGIYDLLLASRFEGTFIHSIGLQFQHQPWNGLRLWDLGHPFFLFISGAAMIFAYGRRWEKGESWKATLGHAARRSFLLFVFGWALYHISPVEDASKGVLYSDILPQLAVASFVAFLLLRRPVPVQLGFAAGLVVLTELLYRFWPVPGFDQSFAPGRNFGSYLDSILFGTLSENHWVAFNIVPAAAYVILGVVAGGLLRSERSSAKKLSILVGTGLLGVGLGLALSPLTPIIKRISTSSFVILSGGLALLALALGYWLIDMARIRKGALFFLVVGMNPIFIYLFALSGGGDWLRKIVEPFTMGFSGWIGEGTAFGLTSLAVWAMMWGLCSWLYRRRIFIKI